MSLLRSIFGAVRPFETVPQPTVFIQMLANYPPNTPPFQGLRRAFTPAQLDANLAHLVETIEQRLIHVTQFLAQFGIDAAPLLNASQDPIPTANAIDSWLTIQSQSLDILPRSTSGVCPVEEFQNSDRSGNAVIYSFVADLALLEGEAIQRRDTRFYWAINREVKLRSQETAKRPCLIRPIQPDWAMPVAIDLEMGMLSIIHERRSDTGVLHRFGEQLISILGGAYRS